MAEFGILTDLVDDIGSLMAAAIAIGATFRGQAKWEPAEEDLPNGPRRIGGLLTAVGIGLLWWNARMSFNSSTYTDLLRVLLPGTLAAFLGYIMLITVYVYHVPSMATAQSVTEWRNIIGGLWISKGARESMKRQSKQFPTIKALLAGSAYDPDLVWPRGSRALSKLLFNVAYLALIAGGTLSLAAIAILMNSIEASTPG